MGDQDRISPCKINTISNKQWISVRELFGDINLGILADINKGINRWSNTKFSNHQNCIADNIKEN